MAAYRVTWLKRNPVSTPHECSLPMRDVMIRIPRGPAQMPKGKTIADYPEHPPHKIGERPDGDIGDTWLCDICCTLWKIARKPSTGNVCAPLPSPNATVWRKANWLDRVRHDPRVFQPEAVS